MKKFFNSFIEIMLMILGMLYLITIVIPLIEYAIFRNRSLSKKIKNYIEKALEEGY